MIDLKAKLSGRTHQTDELMKENANLKSEVAALHEHMDKVKEEAIEEYQVSQPYFDEMRGYYGDRFEDFRKQAILMFLDLDFSQSRLSSMPRRLLPPSQLPMMWRSIKRCW